jgi:hypothetical protein
MLTMPIYVLLALLLWPAAASAKGRKPTHIQQPYAQESTREFSFRAIEDDQGGFFLIWPHKDAGRLTLLGQHIGPQGTARVAEPGQALVTIPDETPPVIWDAVADSKGGLVFAWEEDAGRVRAQRFGADLAPLWGASGAAVGESTATQKYPALAPDGSGGAYVIWQDKSYADRWVLMGQHLQASGAKRWAARGVRISLRPSNQKLPRAVNDGNAGVIVAWQDFRESASQLQIQRLDFLANRLWGVEGVVVTAPADTVKPPFLAAVGGGSGVVAWQASSAGNNRIFLQRIDARGQPAWPQSLELNHGSWHEWNPVLHGDGQGGTWVGWEDYRSTHRWQVFVQHLNFDGNPAWPAGEALLADVSADQGHIGLTDNGKGGILAVWVDNRYGEPGLFGQVIAPDGRALLGDTGKIIADGLINPQTPQVIYLGPGRAALAWADMIEASKWSLYWRRMTAEDVGIAPSK